ncbi:MAG: ATP-binding cassette domain-containing protein, partial [Pseudomonadota bacterium]
MNEAVTAAAVANPPRDDDSGPAENLTEVRPDAAGVALSLRNVQRRFHQGEVDLDVLRGVDLDLPAGEVRALVGPSGSGKSTLLQIAGLLEHPDSGDVVLAG